MEGQTFKKKLYLAIVIWIDNFFKTSIYVREWEEREKGREPERENNLFSLNTDMWVWWIKVTKDLQSNTVRMNGPLWWKAGRWL